MNGRTTLAKKTERIITFLQSIRLLQTPNHRAVHHTNPKNVRYCPITNLVTPILDRFHFWADRERLLAHALGLHRRPETSLPAPDQPRMAATPARPVQSKDRKNRPANLKSRRYWPKHNSTRPGAAER